MEIFIVNIASSLAHTAAIMVIYGTISLNLRKLSQVLGTTLRLSKKISSPFWKRLLMLNLVTIVYSSAGFVSIFFLSKYKNQSIKNSWQRIAVALFYSFLVIIVNAFVLLTGNLLRILTAVLKINNGLLKQKPEIKKLSELLNTHCEVTGACQELNVVLGPGLLLFFVLTATGLFLVAFMISLHGFYLFDGLWILFYFWNTLDIISATSAAAEEVRNLCFLFGPSKRDCLEFPE